MKSTFLLLALFVMLLSCSSDEQENQEEVPEKNFYALSVGNTWVYKYYTSDNTTNEYTVFAHKTDSVKIVGEEIFNNKTYYEFYTKSVQTENNNIPGSEIGEIESTEYFRDSLGYLIDNKGNIEYWNNNYEERFWYQHPSVHIFNVYGKLNDLLSDITVEAGDFECQYLKLYVKHSETNEQAPGASHYYFADGVGSIWRRIGVIATDYIVYEKRLDSYNVE